MDGVELVPEAAGVCESVAVGSDWDDVAAASSEVPWVPGLRKTNGRGRFTWKTFLIVLEN